MTCDGDEVWRRFFGRDGGDSGSPEGVTFAIRGVGNGVVVDLADCGSRCTGSRPG